MAPRNAYENLSDTDVFNKARDALRERAKLPADSSGYAFWTEIFDSAMLELGWRVITRAFPAQEEAQG